MAKNENNHLNNQSTAIIEFSKSDQIYVYIINQIKNEFLSISRFSDISYCIQSVRIFISIDICCIIITNKVPSTNINITVTSEYSAEFKNLMKYLNEWLLLHDVLKSNKDCVRTRQNVKSSSELFHIEDVNNTVVRVEDMIIKFLDLNSEKYAKQNEWQLAETILRLLIDILNKCLELEKSDLIKSTDYYRYMKQKANSLTSLGHTLVSKYEGNCGEKHIISDTEVVKDVALIWEQSAILYSQLSDMRAASKVFVFAAKLLSDSINIKPFETCLDTNAPLKIANKDLAETASYLYTSAAKCSRKINISSSQYDDDVVIDNNNNNMESINFMFMAGVCIQHYDNEESITIFESLKSMVKSIQSEFENNLITFENEFQVQKFKQEFQIIIGDIAYHLACCYYRKGNYDYCLEEAKLCYMIVNDTDTTDNVLRKCKGLEICVLSCHAVGLLHESEEYLHSLKCLYATTTTPQSEIEKLQVLMRKSGRYLQKTTHTEKNKNTSLLSQSDNIVSIAVNKPVIKAPYIMSFREYVYHILIPYRNRHLTTTTIIGLVVCLISVMIVFSLE